jgi:5-methyltetrahydrofolate--homocysteine methyltransferase
MSTEILHPFEALMRERIVILDGAMGTMVQRYGLTEKDFRGKRFADWSGKDLKGSNEVLLLTKPEVIEEIHTQYLEAGADLIETNTFSATTLGSHDFLFKGEPTNGRKDPEFFQRVVDDPELRALAHEMNVVAAQLARNAADRVGAATGAAAFRCRIAGPMPVTGSLSPDVNDPAFAR